MKLPLKEPLFGKYLYISEDNIIHVLMPVVSGTSIGLDNTCKAVLSLQEFFGKGSNSNQKATLKGELLKYKGALENDLSLLNKDALLTKQKQERLTQINAYLKVITALEHHKELECLNQGFPSYPRPLEELMQNRETSNLYSMVLRPTEEDGYLRSEAANPIFSVAHKSVARDIKESVSPLQQALIKAYKPLTYKARDLKSQVIETALAPLKPLELPVDFKKLRAILQKTVQDLLNVSIDFTKTKQDAALEQKDIDEAMLFDVETTPKEYIDALLAYCAPDLFKTVLESPFNSLTQAEDWSIATQFLLGITNIYCVSQDKVSKDTNFGKILDNNPELNKDLAQTLAKAQKAHKRIEKTLLSWINEHAKELMLKKNVTQEEVKLITERFTVLYAQIKDSPHFDEFFICDSQKKGDFVIHQGSIGTSFAQFACSDLFELSKELIEPLQKARKEARKLNTEIPHKSPIVQGEVDIDTKSMNSTELQALYERINTYDSKIKEQLNAELKKERPDFKPQIDAKQFLQHVAYGEQNEAEDLLKKDNEFAQELLTASDIPFTDYSGRTFTCTAYEYAYWAKDAHMCRMLEQYMDDNTKKELLNRVERMEEPIGEELFKKPRGLLYTQKGNKYRSDHFDLTPLKQALKTYIEAYDNNEDSETLEALWIKVGLSQRDVPAHIAHEYCHPKRSFDDVSQNPSLLDASKSSNLERSLKFYNWVTNVNDFWFTPNSYSVDSGLGFSFAILRGLVQWWGGVASRAWVCGGAVGDSVAD
ncbi:SidC [Legionella fallonii]|uniref:SidC N-terminal domain-containing protein n=1 Tax=Legionella fallonii LLAP-10 TaxID=1212491 RepID=A0A098G530_9GAMM|nr:SidC [Legionella fallonii]CEG56600.1 conserved protein of unknown function [Legionella fallonii LLAP-10]